MPGEGPLAPLVAPWHFAGPLEVAALLVECPWLVVVNDVRKNFFYASFMTFFLYLTDKHLEVREEEEEGEGVGVPLHSCSGKFVA